MKNGLLIFSAPSGSGKSTIVNWLMKEHPELKLAFSISCTSRAPRGTEQNGVEYFFLSPEEFKAKIKADEFLEYEEVYQDRFYGTLKSQVENQLAKGESVIFDVDVKGGVNIKKFYGERALSIFVQPPSVEELRLQAHCQCWLPDADKPRWDSGLGCRRGGTTCRKQPSCRHQSAG
jgi:guanylate kinase